MLRRSAGLLIGIGIAVWAGVAGLLLLAAPRWSLGPLVGDDAGYYLAISRNFLLGYGYSFDRLHATNGFNPLLAWIQIGFFRLLPHDLPLLLCYRISVLISLLAFAGGLWAFLGMARLLLERDGKLDATGRFALAAAFAFYSLFIVPKGYYGLDAPLVLLLGGIYLWRVGRFGIGRPGRDAVIDGLLLGLVFMARVDSAVLIAVSFGLIALRILLRRQSAVGLVQRIIVLAAVVAPMFIWSTRTFGTWMPISASLKTAFPALRVNESLRAVLYSSLNSADLASFAAAYVLSGITTILMLRSLVTGRIAEWLEPPRVLVTTFTLYVFGRLTFLLLFSRFDVQGSYAILAHAYVVLIVLWIARQTGGRIRPVAGQSRLATAGQPALAAAAVALVAVGGVLFLGKMHKTLGNWELLKSGTLDEWTLGNEIRSRTAPGEVIYGGAYGLLGYFSDRPWINGDGVANNLEYQEVLRRDSLPEYLQRCRVRYVATAWIPGRPVPHGPVELTIKSQLYGGVAHLETDGDSVVVRAPTLRRDFLLLRYES